MLKPGYWFLVSDPARFSFGLVSLFTLGQPVACQYIPRAHRSFWPLTLPHTSSTMSADDEPKPVPLPIAESESGDNANQPARCRHAPRSLESRKLTDSRQALLHAWQSLGARDGQHQGPPHNGVEERECTDVPSGRRPAVTPLEPHGARGRCRMAEAHPRIAFRKPSASASFITAWPQRFLRRTLTCTMWRQCQLTDAVAQVVPFVFPGQAR